MFRQHRKKVKASQVKSSLCDAAFRQNPMVQHFWQHQVVIMTPVFLHQGNISQNNMYFVVSLYLWVQRDACHIVI